MNSSTEKGVVGKEYGADSGSDREQGELSEQSPEDDGLLHKKLQGRHMQMIAIGNLSQLNPCRDLESKHVALAGGSIGAGLFVGSGQSFVNGGPGSVVRFVQRRNTWRATTVYDGANERYSYSVS